MKGQVLCSNNNEISQICFDKDCKESQVFIYTEIKCQCLNKHRLCMRGNINKALGKIRSKLKNTDELKVHIEKTFDSIISYLT